MRTNVPAALRTLRRRRAWRQADLGRRAGLSRDPVSRAERGDLNGLTVGSLSRLVEAVEATLIVEVRWRGADLDRLVDREHAAAQETAARRLAAAGWLTSAEVSFNHFGDRGRCDLVAWHPATRTALIVEVKSRLGDVQETLGTLDVKRRLGSVIAERLGWPRPARVVAALALIDLRSTRRVLAEHESLFGGFRLRGRSALAWLRAPATDPGGVLWFELLSDSDQSRVTSTRRVRNRGPAG
ncbi:MAG TPA: hypothetical protein VJA85_09335 [Candidatus Limnocylindria bacterium]|nr:hypothetical protein [Candidatus Limnocylindria bacterium]